MNVKTRIFGEIAPDEDNIIYFPKGIIGFPDLNKFVLMRDQDKPNSAIMWLQSLDEGQFALPVLVPNRVIDNYAPSVDDGLLQNLGEFSSEDLMLLVTITVPSDIKKMSVNLKAPIIINHRNRYACQAVAENEEYEVKHKIYDKLKKQKEGE